MGRGTQKIVDKCEAAGHFEPQFREVIDNLALGQEVVITDNEQPVAKLVGERPGRPRRPAPGAGKGSILDMAPDFDEPMEEFKEYK
jgi:antitoxin (DNA-binding transcriptional repressor) of toxin-antitoxin stability system